MTQHNSSSLIPIENKKFLCVEYPGVVKNPARAIKTLGGEKILARSLALSSQVNLWHRPEDPFSHPINGELLETTKIVVKVSRCVKKKKLTGKVLEICNRWNIEVVGNVTHTVRFRTLADLQYIVSKKNAIGQLKNALNFGNVETLINFKIFPEKNDDKKENRSIPPPVFSVRQTPSDYGYRQNLPVMRVKVKQSDGSYKIGLINRDRRTALEVTQVKYDVKHIPTESWQLINTPADPLVIKTIELVKILFEKRPIWSRLALRGHVEPVYYKHLTKALVHHSYTFSNGPWRDTWVKYGVDPRTDQKYYKYQILSTRMVQNLDKSKNFRDRGLKSVLNRRKVIVNEERDNHIFDGVTERGPFSKYQMCDITDPLIAQIIHCKDYLKPDCNFYSGFYYQCVYDHIRGYVKAKHLQIAEKKTSTLPIVSHKTMCEEIELEIEKRKNESERLDISVAENAVLDAQTKMETSESSKRLKEAVDEYIQEFERSGDDESRYLNNGDDSDFDIIDEFDEYDDIDLFNDDERNDLNS